MGNKRWNRYTSNRIDVELGARIFKHLLRLPLAYFESRRVGDSVARVRELETIRQFITSSSITLVLDLAFCAVFLGVMFIYSATLAFVVVAALPLYALLSIATTPAFRRRLDEKFRRGAENQAFLVESVTGVETIKAMAVEPQMQHRWEEQLAGYVGASFAAAQVGNWASQTANLLNKGVGALTLFLGAGLVIANEMTVGELVAFNMLAAQVSGPVLRLVQVWQDFHQVRLSVERLGDILNTPVEANSASAQASHAPLEGAIEFERVTFRYGLDAQPVLRDVSLKIPAGQVVGIVGPSGSGKSTIAKLAQRLYQPEAGRVLIDGIDAAVLEPVVAAAPDRRGAAGEHSVQSLGAGKYRARRSGAADRARSSPPRSSPVRMSSSAKCRMATTRRSASAACRCPAASASASPSPVPWSAIRAC